MPSVHAADESLDDRRDDVVTAADPSALTITRPDPDFVPEDFNTWGKPPVVLVQIGYDGSLTFGPDYEPDDAAVAFWEAIARYVPPFGHQTGADLIVAERIRQLYEERWTPEHDDGHDSNELLEAALAYANWIFDEKWPDDWPWDADWFKPSDKPVRNLIKAGALIAAEIDRLLRAGEEV